MRNLPGLHVEGGVERPRYPSLDAGNAGGSVRPDDGANLFDATRLEFPFAAGPRVSLTALDCEGWGFEVNFFGIDGWSATTDIPNGSLPSGRPT